MADNQKRILEMLADKKISVDEAQRLLALVESPDDPGARVPAAPSERGQSAKYLRVVVQPGSEAAASPDAERVNIRVPMNLIRAGMKLTALIPPQAASKVNEALKEKGVEFDLRNLKAEDLEEVVDALSDLEVDVESGKEKVRIYVE